MPTRTLKVTLKREFFDAIHAGEKKEEYRAYTKFWISRLLVYNEADTVYDVREYDTILFRNGYNPDSPTMEVEYKGLFVDTFSDVPEDAPEEERLGFAIQLGKVLKTENYQP
jgi:hypothetical protein